MQYNVVPFDPNTESLKCEGFLPTDSGLKVVQRQTVAVVLVTHDIAKQDYAIKHIFGVCQEFDRKRNEVGAVSQIA